MTLVRRRDGIYEGDFREKGYPRFRLSMGTSGKADAEIPHDFIVRLLRTGKHAIVDQLRLPKADPLRMTIADVIAMANGERLAKPNEPTAEASAAPAARRSHWGTVDDEAERYLAAVKARPVKRRNTANAAKTQLTRFRDYAWQGQRIGALLLEDVTSAMVLDYQAALVAAGLKTNTLTNYMGRVRALYRWVAKQEERRAREEKRAPVPLYLPLDAEMIVTELTARDVHLTEAQAAKLLEATPDRLLFTVACALFAGLRLNEVLHLRPQDVDLERGTIRIQKQQDWRPKTDRSIRTVPVSSALRPYLERQLREFASDRWVVPSPGDPTKPFKDETMSRLFAEAVRRAGLPQGRKDPHGIVFHTLRHTFASWLAMRGVDLLTIARLLGDTFVTVEKTYAHLSPDHKKEAVERLAGVLTTQTVTGAPPAKLPAFSAQSED